jgi:hypothetical protein
MTNRQNEELLKELVSQLELPERAYAKAVSRYEDLGEWMGREASECAVHSPHIFPQGSFRLGTAIRPLKQEEEYDLDLACNLTTGITANTHSQHELKVLVGQELEKYRLARSIKGPLDEKHRCWRLEYADDLSFHMDIVPCIPEEETAQNFLAVAMESYGLERELAKSVAERAVGITDDRHPRFKATPSDWMISNPEGYAKWFESRMQERFEMRASMEAAQVDEVPLYKRKKPLQRVIQLLKRHRDTMFAEKPDSKPISVIITTLAARSYSGSTSLEESLREVIAGFNQFVDSNEDVVNNPVNPEENFADRWDMPEYADLQLKQNFSNWVHAVTRDFESLLVSDDTSILHESLVQNFGVNLSEANILSLLGLTAVSDACSAVSAPKLVANPPAKPWLNKE